MCKECGVKQYESFEELPQELKDKFKPTKITKQTKDSFLYLINELNKRGDKLIGDYVKNQQRIMIDWVKCGHVCDISADNYKAGHGCPVCRGYVVQKGVNDIATTNPDLVKYFVNVEDAYTHTKNSHKKVMMKCPHCNYEKVQHIDRLYTQGFGCNKCSDGISYPEKLMMNVLENLDIEYTTQFRFEDCRYKYDFYLIDLDTIIEVHGEQHYAIGGCFGKHRNELENDMYKYDLAVLHGYEYNKNYFVIDARKSNIEWLRNSIEQCDLFKQFDLSNVDWQDIDMKSQKSLKIEVCQYWQEQKTINKDLTTTVIAKEFKIDRNTVVIYLKWGNENGFCEYNSKEQTVLAGNRSGKLSKQKTKSIYLFDKQNNMILYCESISEMSQKTGISTWSLKNSATRKVTIGTSPKAHGQKFDSKYNGCYTMFENDYLKQFNRNNSDSKIA